MLRNAGYGKSAHDGPDFTSAGLPSRQEPVRRAIVALQRMGVHANCVDWSLAPLYIGVSKEKLFCGIELRNGWDGDVRRVNELIKVVTGGQRGVSIRVTNPKRGSTGVLQRLPRVPLLGIHAPGMADEDLAVLPHHRKRRGA